MGANLSAEQAHIIEALQPVAAGEADDPDARLETLLQGLPDENLSGPFGVIALIAACHGGHAQCAMTLIMAGCDVSAVSDEEGVSDVEGETGVTPLIAAAAMGHGDCIRECLKAGADPLAKTSLGRTALDAAASSGSEEAVRVMREAPHIKAAAISRRTSAYTKAHLGLNRMFRQAIAVHVIDYTDTHGDTRYLIESEDNFRGERQCYYVSRSVSEFRQLHSVMVNDYAALPKSSFPYAGKAKAQSAEAKRERMMKLEDYLRLVLSKIEESVGGRYAAFHKGTAPFLKPEKERSPAELPYEIVMFLGLEDTGFPDSCRAAIQALRHRDGGSNDSAGVRPMPKEGEACPLQ
mmetsp:Transcript_23088/g.58873  ORF Transcript_23088/g.58873 Transcript_23088/m.58873 type:complete len:350 (-) Transcript_23088:129-1178(-)